MALWMLLCAGDVLLLEFCYWSSGGAVGERFGQVNVANEENSPRNFLKKITKMVTSLCSIKRYAPISGS